MLDKIGLGDPLPFDRGVMNVASHRRPAEEQEAVKMIDDFLPRLTRAGVRQMAGKMRADQQREIQEFRWKQAG